MKYKSILLTFLLTFALTATASAADIITPDNQKDFTADSWQKVDSDKGDEQLTGRKDTDKITDSTQKEELTEEEKRQQEIEELEKKIEDVLDQIANNTTGGGSTDGSSGTAGKDPWSEFPDVTDKDTWNPGSATLPDPTLPENPTLDPGKLPEDGWGQFDFVTPPQTIYIPPEYVDSDNDDEILPEPAFEETEDGFIYTQKIKVPISLLTGLAGLKAEGGGSDGPDPVPEIIVTQPETPEPIRVGKIFQIPGVVNHNPFDFEGWLDDFKDYIEDQLPVKPGEYPEGNDFPTYPDIDDTVKEFPGIIGKDEIPGTNIDVGVVTDNQKLYELLYEYMQRLYELKKYNVTVTRYIVYQLQECDIQTIRLSVPLADYRWIVTGPGGTVEKTTSSDYVKILFRTAGNYNVQVFNTRNVWRNNKVSGIATEYWVLNNGDFFDGVVVHKTSKSFSGYISQDIGPTEEEVELKENGFNANVSASQLNKIMLIDDNGNIRSPSGGFTTERG